MAEIISWVVDFTADFPDAEYDLCLHYSRASGSLTVRITEGRSPVERSSAALPVSAFDKECPPAIKKWLESGAPRQDPESVRQIILRHREPG